MATPTPAKPAQIAIACGRSLGGNTWARIDSVAGITNAAPTPITARAPIKLLAELDNAANTDAAPNTIRPPFSASAAPVAVTERPGRQQEPGEHEAVRVDDPLQRARARRAGRATRVGNATLRLAFATTIITRLRQSTASVHHRRS